MRILFIEPYDGGSHQAFRQAVAAASRHEVVPLTLPARFWKWRMRAAAAWFADRIRDEGLAADLIVCSDYLDVAGLRGLLPEALRGIPILLYMHENQLTYPLSPEETFDFHFGFTNIVSCLASDRVVFNSEFHRAEFLGAVDGFLARMPEGAPEGARERIEERSCVLPVGIDRSPRPAGAVDPRCGGGWAGGSPVLLWNHRWEFDKRPEWLVEALTALEGEGRDFRLHLLGEPRNRDGVFGALRERIGERILSYGHRPDRADYDRVLEESDVVISCAAQENFGISVAEAIHAGCHAVLPREQVYPSLYGDACGGRHLYDGAAGLVDLLRDLIDGACDHRCSLPAHCDEFCWSRLAGRFDALCDETREG